MKNNKKFALGSVVALALSVGILAPSVSDAANTQSDQDAPLVINSAGETDKSKEKDISNLKAEQGEPAPKLNIQPTEELKAESDSKLEIKPNEDLKAEPDPSLDIKTNDEFEAKKTEEWKRLISESLKTPTSEQNIVREAVNKVDSAKNIEELKKAVKNAEEVIANAKNNHEDSKELENAKENAISKINESELKETIKKEFINEVESAKDVKAVKEVEDKLAKAVYASKLEDKKAAAIAELKKAGITSDFFLDQIRKAKTIEGVEALKNELLKAHIDGQTPEDDDEEIEENNKNGFLTEENAIKAAKEALKKDPKNNTYTIYKGANGRYYYYLSYEKDAFEDVDSKNQDKKKKKHNNVKTGVAGLTGVVGTLTAAAVALFSTKKRK